MALPDQPERQYTNQAQLVVAAPDPATAQAALEAAVTAARAAIAHAALPAGATTVALLPEVENGVWVLSESG